MPKPDTTSDPMIPSAFKVERFITDTHDTFSLELSPATAGHHFSFKPGQFNMLYIFGVGEAPISISGDPYSPLPVRHTVRAVGNVTKRMSRLKAGETIGVRGPFGSHWPLEQLEGKDAILVAGGIGLAPLRPVLVHIIKNRKKYNCVSLCYGTRTPADILCRYEFIHWEMHEIEVHVTVDHAARSWKGNVGVVPSLIPRMRFDPRTALAFVCGPEVMINFSVRALMEQGLAEENIYLSLERNMKCAVGFCGHCQYGPHFVCKDGPVFCYRDIRDIFRIKEI